MAARAMTRPSHAVLVAIAFSLAGAPVAGSGDTGRDPRIVNGLPTQQRPTTGALLVGNPGTFLFGICTATLVGCQHVVTAAHCVCDGFDFATCGTPDPTQYHVYLQHAGVLPVSAISVNPNYSFATAGDVAVLTLASGLTGIRPTPINTTADPGAGMSGTIAGYGVTGGGFDDFGLLRQGMVTVSSCGGAVPEPAHVCWTFADPVGPPGTDSNTCFGDSGGPLVVNFGGGDVLGGVTSGITSADCAPTHVSFDTNVYQNRTYIQSVGGGDLLTTSCGGITQVGDAGTVMTAMRFDGLPAMAVACRNEVTKSYMAYVKAKLQAMEKCIDGVNRGSIAGPCPDTPTAEKIARAAEKIDAAKLGLRCTPSVIWTIYKANGCAGATDASGLRTCVLNAGDTAVTDLLDVEYADAAPSGPIADGGLLSCQTALAKTAGRYGIGRLKILTKCRSSEDRGTVAECPDIVTQSKLARLALKVEPAIAVRCTDEQIATLNGSGAFGDGCSAADSVATIASCEVAKHDVETNGLLALLDSMGTKRRTAFNVPGSTARLRATVNGIDAGANDVDLYLRQGAPPTTALYDAKSSNSGMYEGIDLASPSPGTWYVLVQAYSGANLPFQLTITTFGP